jgi:hypothetical protein
MGDRLVDVSTVSSIHEIQIGSTTSSSIPYSIFPIFWIHPLDGMVFARNSALSA